MNKFEFKKSLNQESTKKGLIQGVAYSGEAIPFYGPYENFIIDLGTLQISKPKIPLLRDHFTDQVAGHATAELKKDSLLIDGNISKNTEHGKEIIALSEDEFEWELSVGVYDANVEEAFTGKVNGRDVENAVVLRNGILREVSIVALGADRYTSVSIFNANNGGKKMNEKEFKALTVALKLDEKSTAKQVIAKLEEIQVESEEVIKEKEETISALESSIETLEEAVKELETEIEEIKEETEIEEREEEVEAMAKAKGVSIEASLVKEIAKSKESFEMFKLTINSMKIEKKIAKEFTKKDDFGAEKPKTTSVDLRDQANKLVKEGKYNNFMSALTALQGAQDV